MEKDSKVDSPGGEKQLDEQGVSPLLTADELAQFFRVKPSTIRRWARLNKIPQAIKCGNAWRFHRAVLEMKFSFDDEV